MKTLRDKFFKELTRKRDDGVTEFNRSPHNVFEWIKENLDSEWVSDEEIEEEAIKYVKDCQPLPLGADEGCKQDFKEGAKWMRDKLTKQ